MPRVARVAPGGIVYHVLNRANGRLRLFKKPQDFLAFERVLLLAHQRVPIRVLDWCLTHGEAEWWAFPGKKESQTLGHHPRAQGSFHTSFLSTVSSVA
jgi:hypothetical protein